MHSLEVLRQMVEEFQCPGCVCGSDTNCGVFKMSTIDNYGVRCESHCAGTLIGGAGCINLSLPKGFNRVVKPRTFGSENYTNIRLHLTPDLYKPDRFNVAVWAMEENGYLFVRIYCPRTDRGFVDVVKGGAMALVPGAVNVEEFIDEMD